MSLYKNLCFGNVCINNDVNKWFKSTCKSESPNPCDTIKPNKRNLLSQGRLYHTVNQLYPPRLSSLLLRFRRSSSQTLKLKLSIEYNPFIIYKKVLKNLVVYIFRRRLSCDDAPLAGQKSLLIIEGKKN